MNGQIKSRTVLIEKYTEINKRGAEQCALFTFLSSKKLASIEGGKKEVFEVRFGLPAQEDLLYDIQEGDTVMFSLPNPEAFIERLKKCTQITGIDAEAEKKLREEVRLDPISFECIQLITGRAGNIAHSEKEQHIVQAQYDIPGFLSLFPDVTISVDEILATHPKLKRRTYDIISYDGEKREVAIDVVVNIPSEFTNLFGVDESVFPDGVQKFPYGFSSYALSQGFQKGDQVCGHLKRYPYALPERFFQGEEDKKLILVAPGVAIGHVLYFLEERLALLDKGQDAGKIVLIIGGQFYPDMYLYRDEIQAYLDAGILEGVYYAASREKGEVIEEKEGIVVYPSAYVGDVLLKKKEEIWKLLDEGAYLYVNGPKAVADGVEHVLAHIAHLCGGLSHEEAHHWVPAQLESLRYMKIAGHVPRLSPDQRP